jgi:hypothetical protein
LRLRLLRGKKELVILLTVSFVLRLYTWVSRVYFGARGIPALFPPVAWNDFYGIYVVWLQSVSQGMLPYRDFLSYTYTPLFLYLLYPFYAIGGTQLAALPIISFDAATSSLVYLIVRRIASNRVSLLAGLAYAVCPFALFYEGYLWLSSQPMTFFILLTVLLLRRKKPISSALSMAVTILFKQEAIFMLPAFGVWFAKWFKRSIRRGTFAFLLTLLVVSLPFLVLAPVNYLWSLTYRNPAQIAETCVNQLINGTTVAVCGGSSAVLSHLVIPPASTTTSSAVSTFPWEYLLNILADIVAPILFVVELPAIISSRRAANGLELLAVYSTIGFLILFTFLTRLFLSYHYLPVYALLLASTRDRRTLLVTAAAPVIGLFLLPEGIAGSLTPLVALLLMLVIQDEPSKTKAALSQIPLGPGPVAGIAVGSPLGRSRSVTRDRSQAAPTSDMHGSLTVH